MKKYFFLFLICLLFLVTRLFKISEIPPSVYWDEASIGYNAYAIGIDGRDEWGEFLPLHFRAFGEFKLPVYIYSVAPFVKIFGLDAFSVRFPSVLYSLGIVLVTYLLAKKISKNETVSVFSAFFVAVTPWLFIFSRTGYEATAGLLFFLLGIYLCLKSIKRPQFFLVATLSFIASIYSYNSFRLLSPIYFTFFLTFFVFRQRKILKKRLWYFLPSLALLVLSSVPIYRLYRYDTGNLRMMNVGIQGELNDRASFFVKNYISHFSPDFLFSYGDRNLRSQMPGYGQIYWISLPLLICGLLAIFKKRQLGHYLVLGMLILSPLPAAITKECPHALRSILMLPTLAMVAGLGLQLLTEKFVGQKKVIIFLCVSVFLLFFGSYLTKFFSDYSILASKKWQSEYKEILSAYVNREGEKGNTIISDADGQPYIFALFYLKVEPEIFRQTVKYNPPEKWGKSLVASFADFEFR